MRKAIVVPGLRVFVASLAACWAGSLPLAAANTAPAPSDTPVAVVFDAAAARAALDKAGASGQALVADLTLGHDGKVVRAKSAAALTPGRYRLHALVACTATDDALFKQALGPAIGLRMVVGGADDVPSLSDWPARSAYGSPLPIADEKQAARYPAAWEPGGGSGKLTALSFDFSVAKPGPLPVALDWFVRDPEINHEIRPAKEPTLKARQDALDKLNQQKPPAEPAPRLVPRVIAGEGLPPVRLLLAGLVLERLTPVANVRVDGRECYIYPTPVALLAGFDLAQPVKVEVECVRPVQTVVVRPSALGIRPTISGNKIGFPLDAPASLSVEINGDLAEPLFLFADPPEKDAPKPDAPGVKYFAAGKIYEAGKDRKCDAGSGETIYIERGAVVRGRILVNEAKNVKIMGRGILDGGVFGVAQSRPVEIKRSEDVLVEGITIVDSKHWTMGILGSDRVTVRGVKTVSDNKWDDGVVVVGSRDVTVENCFIRTKDDCMAIKSGVTYFTQTDCQGDVENVTVRNCVLWSAGTGGGLQIATHNWLPNWVRTSTWAAKSPDFKPRISNVRNVRFTNNDLIHGTGPEASFTILNGDQSTVSGAVYEDIRVEGSAGPPIDIKIIQSPYNPSPERGHIRDVVFRNVRFEGKEMPPVTLTGFDDKHGIEGVIFENVQVGGRKWAKAEDGPVTAEFATGVEFR